MSFVELLLIAVGLAMDAFAVSTCKGLGMRTINYRSAFLLALFVGGFQALMPLIGWFFGTRLMWLIEPIDHWVAFCLLLFIGAKMIREAFSSDSTSDESCSTISLSELTMIGIATSIDALAVGVSFAALGEPIVVSVIVIGLVTFVLSLVGVHIGNRFGARFEKPANILGGVILILIGVHILVEHLGLLG